MKFKVYTWQGYNSEKFFVYDEQEEDVIFSS